MKHHQHSEFGDLPQNWTNTRLHLGKFRTTLDTNDPVRNANAVQPSKTTGNVKLTCRPMLVCLTVSKDNLEASLQSREDTRMTNTTIFSFHRSVYLKVFAALFFNKSTHYYIFQPVSFIHTIKAKFI